MSILSIWVILFVSIEFKLYQQVIFLRTILPLTDTQSYKVCCGRSSFIPTRSNRIQKLQLFVYHCGSSFFLYIIHISKENRKSLEFLGSPFGIRRNRINTCFIHVNKLWLIWMILGRVENYFHSNSRIQLLVTWIPPPYLTIYYL